YRNVPPGVVTMENVAVAEYDPSAVVAACRSVRTARALAAGPFVNASESTRPCIDVGTAMPISVSSVGAKSTFALGVDMVVDRFKSGPAAMSVLCTSNGLALPWPATPPADTVPRTPYLFGW